LLIVSTAQMKFPSIPRSLSATDSGGITDMMNLLHTQVSGFRNIFVSVVSERLVCIQIDVTSYDLDENGLVFAETIPSAMLTPTPLPAAPVPAAPKRVLFGGQLDSILKYLITEPNEENIAAFFASYKYIVLFILSADSPSCSFVRAYVDIIVLLGKMQELWKAQEAAEDKARVEGVLMTWIKTRFADFVISPDALKVLREVLRDTVRCDVPSSWRTFRLLAFDRSTPTPTQFIRPRPRTCCAHKSLALVFGATPKSQRTGSRPRQRRRSNNRRQRQRRSRSLIAVQLISSGSRATLKRSPKALPFTSVRFSGTVAEPGLVFGECD